MWRAATRAAQEVRETGKVAGKERREWEKGETERRESNTLHIVLHLQPTAEALAAAAVALHEVPSHDLLPQPFIARDRFVAGLPFGVHQRVSFAVRATDDELRATSGTVSVAIRSSSSSGRTSSIRARHQCQQACTTMTRNSSWSSINVYYNRFCAGRWSLRCHARFSWTCDCQEPWTADSCVDRSDGSSSGQTTSQFGRRDSSIEEYRAHRFCAGRGEDGGRKAAIAFKMEAD